MKKVLILKRYFPFHFVNKIIFLKNSRQKEALAQISASCLLRHNFGSSIQRKINLTNIYKIYHFVQPISYKRFLKMKNSETSLRNTAQILRFTFQLYMIKSILFWFQLHHKELYNSILGLYLLIVVHMFSHVVCANDLLSMTGPYYRLCGPDLSLGLQSLCGSRYADRKKKWDTG